MSKRAYEPRGFAKAAIEHLRTLPPDTSLSSAELSEVVGCPSDCLQGNFATAMRYGLIRRERDPEDGRRVRWALGEGKPTAAGDDQPAEDSEQPLNPALSHAEVRAPALAKPATPFAAPLERRGVRCALWSDGSLVIEAGELRLQLDRAEATSVMQYLARVGHAEATG